MKIALRRLTSLGDIINRLDKSALLRELKLAFGKMCADDVVKTWIPPRQLNEINVHDAFNTAETIVMGSERVDIQALAKLAGIKLQGRDADTLLVHGGAEIMIRFLNAIRYNAVLVQNEALTKCITDLTRSESFYDTKVDEKKLVLQTLMQLRHVEIADDTVIQNVDFQAHFESIESDTENYDEYRDEAIRIGNNLSLLYQVYN